MKGNSPANQCCGYVGIILDNIHVVSFLAQEFVHLEVEAHCPRCGVITKMIANAPSIAIPEEEGDKIIALSEAESILNEK